MEYAIVRSNRRTLCVQITPAGEVLVRAPRRCAKTYIDQFVRSHQRWILNHQAIVRENIENRGKDALKTGDTLTFCGSSLRVLRTQDGKIALKDGTLTLPQGDMEEIRPALLRNLCRASLPWVRERMDAWAKKMGISYTDVKMSTARRRWGSCSRDGVIRISVLLLFAPMECIDYVLVHELAHRRVFNHSPEFWTVVREYVPDYSARRGELRQVQQGLFRRGLSQ